jgi:RimJ/RimL family protein N-acetyltransferase
MLLGENVWLRPVFPNDAPGLFSILTNPEQMRYLGSGRVYTQEECCAMITRMANNTLSVSYFPEDLLKENAVSFSWSFFNHQGLSGIIKIFKSTNLTGEDCLEIAYYGKGGTCAAAKIVLDTLDFLVVATCHSLNTKSIKILIQNSFQLTAENIPKYGSIRNYYERKPIIEGNIRSK